MEKNTKKRIIIGLVYAIIFFAVFFGIYSRFKTEATCFDKVKNQNEEDVDCGGMCQNKCEKIEAKDLVIGETGVVESSIVGEYDFYGEVSNPNSAFGSKNFFYQIKFKDKNGAILAEKGGVNFILPGDRKYVIENNIKMSESPASIEFSVSGPEWVAPDNLYEKPDLKIVNKSYEISSGVGFSKAKGLLENKSSFDFSVVKIKVILRDASGKIIALNAAQLGNVRSGENRDFVTQWLARFSGEVSGFETQIEVNVFDPGAFAKKNIEQEKFQEYSQ